MRLLLDTHVLIWALGDPGRLSIPTRAIFEDSDNEVFFSAASIWEIAIKARLGRADFEHKSGEVVRNARATGFVELPIPSAVAERVETLSVAPPRPL